MAKNFRDGQHINSKKWLLYKKSMPDLSKDQFEIAVGMILGDASIQNRGTHAHIKFEQGKKQKDFLYHLFDIFKDYTFMQSPGKRIDKHKLERAKIHEEIKSFWFKTFSHKSFTEIYHLFYFEKVGCLSLNLKRKKKSISLELVNKYITSKSFAYWVMCDGSLDSSKKIMILHTQSFTFEENLLLKQSLNLKFNLSCDVIVHKKIYWVIRIPGESANIVRNLLIPHLIPSMLYKLPKSF